MNVMSTNSELAKKIKSYRLLQKESITSAAKAMGINRTYLSKLENGHITPSLDVLNLLIKHYSLSQQESSLLSKLANHGGGGLMLENFERKEEPRMEEKIIPEPNLSKGVRINVSDKTPVLYTDSVFVTSSQYGVVFDFAQNMASTNQQNIVARVGMSREHAKALLKVLQERLEKGEQEEHIKRAIS